MPAKYLKAEVAPQINVMTLEAIVYLNLFGKMQSILRPMTYYDVIVLQYAWDKDLVFLIARLNKLGIKVVLDFDDDYFNSNPFYPIDYSDNRMHNLVKSISMANLITVTTESLAETYSKYNSNIVILPNAIDLSEYENYIKPKSRYVGWYASGIRFEEFRSILEGWIPDDIYLFLAGSKIFERFKHEHKIIIDRFNPAEIANILANIYIGLIPLKLCKFNNGKSDLKGLEYGAMSIPFIASPTAPYKKLIKHGENGFLAKHGRDWTKYISLLINDAKLRHRMGVEARKVSEARDIQVNINKWTKAYICLK
jgi:glycosyltransferase involved in cell wall biosynthesis